MEEKNIIFQSSCLREFVNNNNIFQGIYPLSSDPPLPSTLLVDKKREKSRRFFSLLCKYNLEPVLRHWCDNTENGLNNFSGHAVYILTFCLKKFPLFSFSLLPDCSRDNIWPRNDKKLYLLLVLSRVVLIMAGEATNYGELWWNIRFTF